MASQGKGRRKPRRKPRQKARAKVVLHAAFHGWEDDTPEMLAKRIDNLRHITAYQHRFTEPEWQMLDRLRLRALANEKFAQAVREARHG
jgi:hypothetical protein